MGIWIIGPKRSGSPGRQLQEPILIPGSQGPGALILNVIDATSGEILSSISPPGTHILAPQIIDVSSHKGKTVRLHMIDQNTEASYAWIGLASVTLKDE
jgi:hypothetical protein